MGHVIIFFLQKDLFSLPAFVLFFLKNNRVFPSLLFLPFQAFWHQKRIQRHRATTRERGKDNQLIHRGREKKKSIWEIEGGGAYLQERGRSLQQKQPARPLSQEAAVGKCCEEGGGGAAKEVLRKGDIFSAERRQEEGEGVRSPK